MVNETIADMTGNVTGEPAGITDLFSGTLLWIWNTVWVIIDIMFDIMETNPVIGLIILIMLAILGFWLLTLSQVAAAQGMKTFLWVGIFIIVVFIILFMQGSFDLTGTFSGWLQGSIGMDTGNVTNATGNMTEVVKEITDKDGTNFWS